MTISILGCGWLGFPLGQSLLRQGYTIKGSTTTKHKYEILKDNSIESYLISVPDSLNEPENDSFFESDVLFLNIPPGRSDPDVTHQYPQKVQAIRNKIETLSFKKTVTKVIFASTTSVYPSESGVYCEENADLSNTARPSGKAVLKAEEILLKSPAFETIVLRFGGLYGYDRHPINFLSGKKNLSAPLKPVNLIHQDDCIGIVKNVLDNNSKSEIYNAVSDGHPPRKTLYQSAARHYNVEPPTFDIKSESKNRVISNEKLKKELDYTFMYPNPLDHTA